MDEHGKEGNNVDSLMAAWMKSATDFWMSGANMWSQTSEGSPDAEAEAKASEFWGRSQTSWMNTYKVWQSLFSSLSTPEAMGAFFKGAEASPDFAMKMSRTAMDSYSALYQQWLKKSGSLSQPTRPYHFENLDEDVLKAWKDLYEKEIRPLLNMPQLGLTRFYQERVSEALDCFNLRQTALAEFLRMLYLPMEKSVKVMEEKLEELSKEGKLSENFKDYYDMWIKVLEGHYMTLFKSPEYLQSLSNVLNTAQNFRTARHRMLTDFLQGLPIPSNKDMDELYREIYLLKKTVKQMAKQMAERQSAV